MWYPAKCRAVLATQYAANAARTIFDKGKRVITNVAMFAADFNFSNVKTVRNHVAANTMYRKGPSILK